MTSMKRKDSASQNEQDLKNLDRLHDTLPQPFRTIDKLISEIFELAWLQITSSDIRDSKLSNNKNKECQKMLYEEELTISEKVHCLAIHEECVLLFSDLVVFVYAFPALKQCATWENKEINPDCINDYIIESCIISSQEDCILMIVVTRKGDVNIVGFCTDTFCVLMTISLYHASNPKRVKMILSENTPHVALCITAVAATAEEEDSKGELLLYKLPKDEWVQNLLRLRDDGENVEEGTEETTEKTDSKVNVNHSSSLLNFTKPTLLRRFQPITTYPTSQSSSMTAILREVEKETNILATGQHHLLSSLYFDNLFQKLDDSNIVHRDNKDSVSCHLLDHPSLERKEIALWWRNTNQILLYPIESCKDHSTTPKFVYHHSDNIVSSTANNSGDMLAVALVSSCITVWNLQNGQSIKTFHVPQQVVSLHFLTSFPSTTKTHFRTSLSLYNEDDWNLQYTTCDAKMWQVTISNRETVNQSIDQRMASPDSRGTIVDCFKGPSSLFLGAWRSGELVLYDKNTAAPVAILECFASQSRKPSDYNNIIFKDQILLILKDESTELKPKSRLLLFDLSNHSHLITSEEKILPTTTTTTVNHESLEDRILNLLTMRQDTDTEKSNHKIMQNCWKELLVST